LFKILRFYEGGVFISAVWPIKAEEIDGYLKTLKSRSGPEFALLAFIGIKTGLRVSDLLKLKYGAFKEQKKVLQVQEGKTGKSKRIEITSELRKAVLDLKRFTASADTAFIFQGKEAGKAMHRSTAYRHLKRAGDACGLERVGTHSLRKSYAQGLYTDSKGDLDFVQKELNHKHQETTLHSYILAGVDIKKLLHPLS